MALQDRGWDIGPEQIGGALLTLAGGVWAVVKWLRSSRQSREEFVMDNAVVLVKELRVDNDRARKELADEREANEKHRRKIVELEREIRQRDRRIAELERENNQRDRRIAELERALGLEGGLTS